MGIDDAMALLYLVQHDEVDVQAVTVTGTGLAHLEPGTSNALDLLALAGAGDVPVARGTELPLAGNVATFPEDWRLDADQLMGVELPSSSREASPLPADELILSILQGAPEKVTLVVLGPLTNVARALQRDPEAAARIERIYIMGGAVDVPGNLQGAGITDNTVAEWNIYIDPEAAALVFATGIPITLVPLDATNQVPIDQAFYERISARHETPAADFVHGVITVLEQRGFLGSGYYFWDPLAAVIASSADVATIVSRPLSIVTAEGPERGWTRPDPSGRPVDVATTVDPVAFESMFLDVLNRTSAED